MFHSLQPHGLQCTRLPCPSLSPGVCSTSCPVSQWCYLTISPFVALFSFCLQSFPTSGSFQQEGSSHQVSKVLEIQLPPQSFQWIFRISFRMDWFDLIAVLGTLKSLLQHHSSKASILLHSAFFKVQLSHPHTSIHDYWKNHGFDYMDLCWQSNVSAF